MVKERGKRGEAAFATDIPAVPHLDEFSLASPLLLAIASSHEGTWTAANPALAWATGRIEREIEGAAIEILVHPDDAATFLSRLADIAAGERVSDLRVRLLREDGSHLAVTWAAFARGGHVHLSGASAIEQAADGSGLNEASIVPPLLAEIQHRARNTLSIIRSIARRTARTSGTVNAFAAHLDGRLGAFARVQGAILRSPDHGVPLDQLVADELAACRAREGMDVKVDGPPLRLRPRLAEALGLALHELAVNAIEHGPLARREGEVEVRWTVVGEGDAARLQLRWKESGGRRATKPKRQGFGVELLERSLPYELGATTRWQLDADGVLFELDAPIAAGVVPSGTVAPGA